MAVSAILLAPPITLDVLLAGCPSAKAKAPLYIAHLNTAMSSWGVTTRLRQAAFLAQILHESGNLVYVEENLNYSADALMRTWPKRFPSLTVANQYARNPEKVANKVYADRMGNRGETSGDGWKYRGSGLIQLTGKDNHLSYAMACDIDLNAVGAVLRSPEGACDSAGWYWAQNNLNPLADAGKFDSISDLINIGRKTDAVGDSIGYKHRLELYNAFKKVLGVK